MEEEGGTATRLAPNGDLDLDAPIKWERCTVNNHCKNDAVCFSDGTAEFCVCAEGYGGRQCERLLDSIRILDSDIDPHTLILLSTLLILLLTVVAGCALLGWVCCCKKHLNARRLYLRNLELIKENRALRDENRYRAHHEGMRLFTGFQYRAPSLIVEEEEDVSCGETGDYHNEETEKKSLTTDTLNRMNKEKELSGLLTNAAAPDADSPNVLDTLIALPNGEGEVEDGRGAALLMKESRKAREGRRRAASLNIDFKLPAAGAESMHLLPKLVASSKAAPLLTGRE